MNTCCFGEEALNIVWHYYQQQCLLTLGICLEIMANDVLRRISALDINNNAEHTPACQRRRVE